MAKRKNDEDCLVPSDIEVLPKAKQQDALFFDRSLHSVHSCHRSWNSNPSGCQFINTMTAAHVVRDRQSSSAACAAELPKVGAIAHAQRT